METETKNNLLKALAETIDNFFQKDAPIDVMEITTFDEVCKRAGENPDDYNISGHASKRERGKKLYSMLELICDVFKDGVVLDYANGNQRKYYPWGEYTAGSGFSLNGV